MCDRQITQKRIQATLLEGEQEVMSLSGVRWELTQDARRPPRASQRRFPAQGSGQFQM